jgi:hypothetical protein
MRRNVTVLAFAAIAGLLLVSCQTGATMWAACHSDATGNPWGTDGSYVLMCESGIWTPKMTVSEFVAVARGQHPTIAPLPPRPAIVPVSTIDQQNVPASDLVDNKDYFIDCRDGVARAQTFTAGRTGTLDKVSVVSGYGVRIDFVDLEVSIRPIASSGAPSATVLGSGSHFERVGGPETWDDVPIGPAVHVVAGQQYAILLAAASSCQFSFPVFGATGNPYSGGSMWTSDPTSGHWQQVLSDDLYFRTWVR